MRGAVETPRLLLMNGLANAGGQVGKNFMAHVGLQLWGTADEDLRPFKGIPGGLISEDTHRPRGADFAGGYLIQSLGVMPVTYAAQLARGTGVWGGALRERMRWYNHAAGIDVIGECLPSAGNFVELSDEMDALGLPKPRVHYTHGPNESPAAGARRGNATAGVGRRRGEGRVDVRPELPLDRHVPDGVGRGRGGGGRRRAGVRRGELVRRGQFGVPQRDDGQPVR